MPTNPVNFPLPQLTYSKFPQAAFAGQLADMGMRDVLSGLAEVTGIDAGFGVSSGTAKPDGLILPAASGDVTATFKGIVVYNAMKEPNGYPTPSTRYALYDSVPYIRKGRIWIMPEHDVVDNGPLYCVITAAGGYTPGRFGGAATNSALVPTAIVLKGATAASGAPALVEINLT